MAAPRSTSPSVLAFRATPFLEDGSASDPRPLLTEGQRQSLAQIGVRVRLPARLLIYEEGTRADWVFLGLSLEAVIRASAELERRRLVAFEGRHLVRVLDPDRLAKLAGAV